MPEDGFIAEGAFGQVLKVIDSTLKTEENVRALKAMKVEQNDVAENELAVLIRLDHVNIVKYYDHFEVNVRDNNQCFVSLDLCVITEFCQVFKLFLKQFISVTKCMNCLGRRFGQENFRKKKFYE